MLFKAGLIFCILCVIFSFIGIVFHERITKEKEFKERKYNEIYSMCIADGKKEYECEAIAKILSHRYCEIVGAGKTRYEECL